MSRGRPRATYADQHYITAAQVRGRWSVLPCKTADAHKVVRKLRREGLEAKALVLDDTDAIVASRWRSDADQA